MDSWRPLDLIPAGRVGSSTAPLSRGELSRENGGLSSVPHTSAKTHDELVDLVRKSDPIGYETLRRMASVERYNRWIFEEIAPFAGQRLLEVGCGIGNMTEYFADRDVVVGIDMLPASVELMRRLHASKPAVDGFLGDITDPTVVEQLRRYRFDTVLCLNVLEHILEDRKALEHMHDLLGSGGSLLLFVPAGGYLYGSLDRALGHHRRYDRSQIEALVRGAGFEIVHLSYLNLPGVPGWWLNSRVLEREILPQGQLAWFNRLAPLFIAVERLMRRIWNVPLGQSLVCIARKAGR